MSGKTDDVEFMKKYYAPLNYSTVDPDKKQKKPISAMHTQAIAKGSNISVKKLGLTDIQLRIGEAKKKGDPEILKHIDLLVTQQLINNRDLIEKNGIVAYRTLKGLQFHLFHYGFIVEHLDNIVEELGNGVGKNE